MTKIISVITVLILISLLYLFGFKANQNAIKINKLTTENNLNKERNATLVAANRELEIKNERLSVRELACQKGDVTWSEKFTQQQKELSECKSELESIDALKKKNEVLVNANQQYEINNEKLTIQLKSCQSINVVEKVKESLKKKPIIIPQCDIEQFNALKARNSLLVKDNLAYEIRAEKAESLQLKNDKIIQQNKEYEIKLDRQASLIRRLTEVVKQLKKEKARRDQYFSDDF